MASIENIKNRICAVTMSFGISDDTYVNFTTIRAALTDISREDFDAAIMELMTEDGVEVLRDDLHMGHLVGQLKANRADEIPFASSTVGMIRFT